MYSLNSRSGGNTGKVRLKALKQAWKESLDAELKDRLGLTVTQGAPYARPALTLADGTYVPALNRESRRMLDKHSASGSARRRPSGATRTRNFRWTHFDSDHLRARLVEEGRGWSAAVFCELFPELAARLKTYESRVATLKRIGYLTPDGRVTDAFTLHYRVHKGATIRSCRGCARTCTRGRLGRGDRLGPSPVAGGWRLEDPRTGVLPGVRTAALLAAGAATLPGAGTGALSGTGAGSGRDTALWDTLHGDQRLLRRLERLGVSPDDLKGVHEEAQRRLPTPETLRRLRQALGQQADVVVARPPLAKRPGIIRAYCAVQGAKVVSIFEISKGLLTLRPERHAALAKRMLEQARKDYFFAKERRLAVVARRMRPIFFFGRIVAPDDVERLELALRRVGDLPARETAEPFLRGHRRRLYRNSYDTLVAQLRAEERQAAREVDRRTIELGWSMNGVRRAASMTSERSDRAAEAGRCIRAATTSSQPWDRQPVVSGRGTIERLPGCALASRCCSSTGPRCSRGSPPGSGGSRSCWSISSIAQGEGSRFLSPRKRKWGCWPTRLAGCSRRSATR